MIKNLYYEPEKSNMQQVAYTELSDGFYQFDLAILWKHLPTGQYYFGEDSGCSCPTPFENVSCLADLTRLTPESYKALEDSVYNSDRDDGPSRSDKREFLLKVKACLEETAK